MAGERQKGNVSFPMERREPEADDDIPFPAFSIVINNGRGLRERKEFNAKREQ